MSWLTSMVVVVNQAGVINMKKLLLLLLLSLGFVSLSFAHSGRTDSSGGHNDYSNGTYHYHNNSGQGAAMMLNARDIGRREGEAYEAAGEFIGGLITSIFGSGNSSPSKKGYYRLFEFGSTWRIISNSMSSSDGKRCTQSTNRTICDNGVTYRQCGNSICGSDGTSYTGKGNCRYTSFGASCCGPASKIVCR